ncbi:PilZ domain-containing protein [Thalassotalea sp. G2M2-11]|uniref:PilZ domain-containing protein n=1 Tax=Thalassotalea sp. G2M2-11 TaxID=2787627 RepID=UPI0019D24769|nr:PilZ domain-containing protein [Thalassotalea sp. G2M2-11]
MPSSAVKIETAARLQRHLGLMQAGSTVTIDISTPAGQKAKFRTTFIGYLPKQYVLIQFPDANKVGAFSQFIVQGAGVTVRGVIEGQEGAVAAFVSSVKQTIQLPSKMIVLGFPKTLTMQSLRKSVRIDTDISAKVKIEQKYWQSLITDVSINGCQLLIDNGEEISLVKDTEIEITLDSNNGLANVVLLGEICSIKNVLNGVSIGVKFGDKSRNDVTKLLTQVVTLEAE